MRRNTREKPEKYEYALDELDYQIIRLFEQRMCTVKKLAGYYKIHDLLPKRKKRNPLPIVEKTTSTACDTEIIEYTEGLVMYMLTVGEKFYKQCLKR